MASSVSGLAAGWVVGWVVQLASLVVVEAFGVELEVDVGVARPFAVVFARLGQT